MYVQLIPIRMLISAQKSYRSHSNSDGKSTNRLTRFNWIKTSRVFQDYIGKMDFFVWININLHSRVDFDLISNRRRVLTVTERFTGSSSYGYKRATNALRSHKGRQRIYSLVCVVTVKGPSIHRIGTV